MNWYKKAQNTGNGADNKDPYGKMIKDNHGVWQYPFNQVKRDSNQGWYIDWFEEQGSIYDINQINIGDQVADSALNMTPYWEVNFINTDSGVINLTPIEPNPFITGIGAGGKKLTDWDYQVQSGEFEKKHIDQVLTAIKEQTAADPRDVAYLLKGTVPVHMGPNGAQGGWYAPYERYYNRGGKEGLTDKEIMMSDAKALQKMGFAVPKGALEGVMDVKKWSDFVNSGGDDPLPEYESEGENYADPRTCAQFVLNHPQPSIKKRNYKALLEAFNPTPQKELNEILKTNPKAYYDASEKMWGEWKEGKNIRTELEPIVKNVTSSIAEMYHPSLKKLNFDTYWHLKEFAIDTAAKYQWIDILGKFENAYDSTNRRWVSSAYKRLGNKEGIKRMLSKETEPEAKSSMEYDLREVGK